MVVFGLGAARLRDALVFVGRRVPNIERAARELAVDELPVSGTNLVGNQRKMQGRRELSEHDEPRRAARDERAEHTQRGPVPALSS